jgi:hypothetical protein
MTRIASCKNHNEKKLTINSVKLCIKTMQENINHEGTNYFTNSKYYGDFDQEFFDILINDKTTKSQLEEICVHRNSILRDRKLSFWGTNYTFSANEFQNWLNKLSNNTRQRKDIVKGSFNDNKQVIVNKKNHEVSNQQITFFQSEDELTQFIQKKIDSGELDIIDKKNNLLDELDKLGYSIGLIERNGYTDIAYDEPTKKFILSPKSNLIASNISKIQEYQSESDTSNFENEADTGYSAPKQRIMELRKRLFEFVVADKVTDKRIYLNALITEVAIQFTNVDDRDPIWSNEQSEQNKTNLSELAKELKINVFPECQSKTELVKLLKNPDSLTDKFKLLAKILLTKPNILVNKLIAENFCNNIGINFTDIKLKNNHFYLATGRPEDIMADGDCLFHSITKLLEK